MRQNKNIADAKGSADRAGIRADQVNDQVRQLERRLEKLAGITEALWELLKEAGQMTEEHIFERVKTIEARQSSQKNRAVVVCPKCNRTTVSKQVKCMYCGQDIPKTNIFDQLY